MSTKTNDSTSPRAGTVPPGWSFYAFLLIALIYTLLLCSHSPRSVQPGDVRLKTMKGQTITIDSTGVRVIVFISPECPMCQDYTLTLNKIQQQFGDSAIQFYAIVTGKLYKKKAIKDYLEHYNLQWTILRDQDQELRKLLGATITPEAFVIGENGNIRYQGLIDNWAEDLTQKRTIITEHYLEAAIDSLIKDQPVEPAKTKAIGCFIE